MLRTILAATLLLLIAMPARAEQIAVGAGLQLHLDLPAGWEIHKEAPAALVDEIAEHVGHEAEAAGHHPTREQLLEVARKRLAANEAIVYHAASGAHLDIDFSRLDEGEKAPSARTLRRSAEAAASSLEGEEGVSAVTTEITEARIGGARKAYRLTADYRHHAGAVRFIGIIGYVEGSWFFFYAKTPGGEPAALEGLEEMLASARIQQTGG